MPNQNKVESPHPGIQIWTNPLGIDIFRLHYSADEDKNEAWAAAQRAGTSEAAFRQECEIDFAAKSGDLLFPNFRDYQHAIIENPFPIPQDWTRTYAVDPHPRVPHAHLWCAVDPWGDRWYYREFWPSKVYGVPGNIPEDDNRYTIKEHVEVVKYLESAENPENSNRAERISRRVIDYAARSFGTGTTDDQQPQENFQNRFERNMRELKVQRPYFQDAIKDRDAGIERVNTGFKALKVEIKGEWKEKARIHILSNLVELIWQLRNNRYPTLTALQQETQDPIIKPIQKRNHQTDLIRYIEMSEPRYIAPQSLSDNWEPMVSGVNY